LVLYADDTNLLTVSNKEEVLQVTVACVMKHLKLWFLRSDLIVNTSETVAMSFHLSQSKPPFKPHIVLLNIEITCKSEVKFLGMYNTENLSWQVNSCSLYHSLSKVYYIKSLKDVFEYPYAMEHLPCLFPVVTEIWNDILGWIRGKYRHEM
jgi:hypothetical protein